MSKRVWNRKGTAIGDPHLNDPRYSDAPLSDPVLRRDESISGPRSWIAGVAEVLLIAFMVIVGWHSSRNNTASRSAPAKSGSAMRQMDPPSTTGSGAGSPQPLTPAPTPPTPPAGETKNATEWRAA